eukprot:2997982-Rhodomonas_salina.1
MLPLSDSEFSGHGSTPPPLHTDPRIHTSHGPPGFPLNPDRHTQSVTWELPAPDSLFSGHCVATFAPPAQYSPAWHSAHGPPAGPKYPALHLQSERASAPTNKDAALAGHAFSMPPSHHLPTLHSVHGPPASPNDPGWHTHCNGLVLPKLSVNAPARITARICCSVLATFQKRTSVIPPLSVCR